MAQKKSKEDRDREFISAVELVVGGALTDWQKAWMIHIRQASLQGKPVIVGTHGQWPS